MLKAVFVVGIVLLCVGGFLFYRGVTVNIPLRKATGLVTEGKYDEAISIYRNLEIKTNHNCHNEIGAAVAAKVCALLEEDDIADAVKVLTSSSYDTYNLSEMAELRRQAREIILNNDELFSLLFAPGSLVPIGSYRPDFSSEMKSTWYILERNDNRILLIKNGDLSGWDDVDTMRGINWESSSLRTELNQNLYKNMFSESERAAILLTVVENTIHDGNAVVPGNDTEDYLFLLSKDEVEKYLELLPPGKMENDGWRKYGDWWTRTVANEDEVKANYYGETDCTRYMLEIASPTSSIGKFIAEDAKVTYGYGLPKVIPAMWVDIDKMLESWA